MSSISSISATDDDDDNVLNDKLPIFHHPCGNGEKRNTVSMKKAKTQRHLETFETTTESAVSETEQTSTVYGIEAASNRVPAVSDRVPAASDRVPAASDRVPAASDRVPAASDRVPAASDRVPAASDRVLAASDRVPAASDRVPAASDRVPATSDRVPAASDRVLAASDRVPAASNRVPAASDRVPAAMTRALSTDTVLYLRRNSHPTVPVAVDSSTQTLNVESKAIQTEVEALLHMHDRKPAPGACHGLHEAGGSSYVPSAHFQPGEVVQQDQGAVLDVRCSRSCDSHHSVDNMHYTSLGHTPHTTQHVPLGNSTRVISNTTATQPCTLNLHHSTHREGVASTPLLLSRVTVPVMTYCNSSTLHVATAPSDSSTLHVATCNTPSTHTRTASVADSPIANPGGIATEHEDMLVVSSLLNADVSGDVTYNTTHDVIHLSEDQHDLKVAQCHKLQLNPSHK